MEKEFSNCSVSPITELACSDLDLWVSRSAKLAGLGLSLRICIGGEFPGVADEVGPERTGWERLLCKILLNVALLSASFTYHLFKLPSLL